MSFLASFFFNVCCAPRRPIRSDSCFLFTELRQTRRRNLIFLHVCTKGQSHDVLIARHIRRLSPCFADVFPLSIAKRQRPQHAPLVELPPGEYTHQLNGTQRGKKKEQYLSISIIKKKFFFYIIIIINCYKQQLDQDDYALMLATVKSGNMDVHVDWYPYTETEHG